MKHLLSWRCFFVRFLFAAGLCFVMAMCGIPDPDMTEAQWLFSVLMLGAASAGCFYAAFLCCKQWRGKC